MNFQFTDKNYYSIGLILYFLFSLSLFFGLFLNEDASGTGTSNDFKNTSFPIPEFAPVINIDFEFKIYFSTIAGKVTFSSIRSSDLNNSLIFRGLKIVVPSLAI